MFEIDTRDELAGMYSEMHQHAHGSPAEAPAEWSEAQIKAAIRSLESAVNEQLGLDESDAFDEPAGAWACDEEPYGGIDAVMEVERDESFFGMCDDEMPGCGEDY